MSIDNKITIPTAEKINEHGPENPEEKLRKRLLEKLAQQGIIRKNEKETIVDLQRFTDPEFMQKFRHAYLGKIAGKDIKATPHLIYELMSDMPIISQADKENSTSKQAVATKPLFNVPTSSEEAFDPEKAKVKDYYLNFWDIYSQVNWDFSIKAKNGEEINPQELALFTKLFVNKKAARNECGDLLVYDEAQKKPIKLNVEWLYKNLGYLGGGVKESVHRFLLDNCPNLLKRNLIKLDDFQIKSEDKSGQIVRKEKTFKKNTKDVMLGGVRYYIGNENFVYNGQSIPIENLKVAILDEDTAGIVAAAPGEGKVLAVFNLLKAEEKEQKYNSIKDRSNTALNKKQLSQKALVDKEEMESRLRPWLKTSDNPPHKDETPKHYANRLNMLCNYDYLNKKTGEIVQETGIGIHNLTWREQQWLAAAVYELEIQGKKDELFDFTNRYGLIGLKTFLTCEFNIDNGKKILDIGKKMDQAEAAKVFKKSAEVIDLAENKKEGIAGLVEGKINSDMEKQIKEDLLGKAERNILDFSGEEKDVDKLLKDLESSKVEIALLSSLLKVAKESGVKLTSENIRGMRMERIEAGELSGGRKEEFREKYEDAVMRMMRKSYEKIFKDNPQAQEKVEENFKARFKNLEKYRVYLLMFQNEAAAFSVINPDDERCEPGEMMSESTVVHPDAQKGSLGIAFLKKIFAQEFERPGVKAIRGQVRVGHPAGKCYDAIGLRVDPSRSKFTEEGVEYEWRAARKENSQSPGNFKSAV